MSAAGVPRGRGLIRPLLVSVLLVAAATVLLMQIDTSPPSMVHDETPNDKVGGAKTPHKDGGIRSVPGRSSGGGKLQQVLRANQVGKQEKKARDSEFWRSQIDWIELATLALAAWLILLTRGQLRVARETMIIAHRAYVGVVRTPRLPLGTIPLKYRVAIKNGGATPATDVIAEAAWFLLTPPAEPTPKNKGRPPESDSVGMLGPDEETQIWVAEELHIGDEQWKDIHFGRKALCLAGRIVYKDVFGKDRETRFCRTYNCNGDWSYCRTGNWAN